MRFSEKFEFGDYPPIAMAYVEDWMGSWAIRGAILGAHQCVPKISAKVKTFANDITTRIFVAKRGRL